MHLHGLKLLIALITILGNAIYPASLVRSSTQYYFNEVADFDDIIEENKDSAANFKESSRNQEPDKSLEQRSDLFENAHLISSSRIKTDVRGVENSLTNPQSMNQLSPAGESQKNVPVRFQPQNQPEVIFETPVLYEIGDRPQRQGYFMVKQRNPDGAAHIRENPSSQNDHEGGIIETSDLKSDQGNSTNSEELKKEPSQHSNNASDTLECQGFHNSEHNHHKSMQEPKAADFEKTCHQLFDIFHQIPLVQKMIKEIIGKKDTQAMNKSWKSIKCIIREQHPNMAKNNILERPESKNCFRRYVKRRRRKRHSTYINLRNPRKKINNNLAKRNAENDLRFKSIIDFIIKNREFMDKYTYVPVVFATVKEPSTSEKEATTQMAANLAEELIKTQNFGNNGNTATTFLSSQPSPLMIPSLSPRNSLMIPPSSEPSPLMIPSSSEPSPLMIPLSSQASPPIIPPSSQANPPMIPPSSEPSPLMIHLSSQASPFMIPPSSQASPLMIPPSGEPSPLMIPPSSQANLPMIPPSSQLNPLMIPPSSEPSSLMIPLSSQPSPPIIHSSSQPNPLMIPPSSQPNSLPIPPSPANSMPVLPPGQSMQLSNFLENTGVHVDTTHAMAINGPSVPPNGPPTANTPVNPLLSQQARNLTNELSFRLPQLRRSFQDIMEIMNSQTSLNRAKKEVNATQPSLVQSFTEKTQVSPQAYPNDRIVTFPNIGQQSERIELSQVLSSSIILPPFQLSDNSTPIESKTFNEKDMIPGVLIYPITQKNNMSKRNVFDLLDKDDDIGRVTFGNEVMDEQVTDDSLDTIVNQKFIDFNPQPKLKKEANDCQNETEEMLNILKSLNMKMPEDTESSKKDFTDSFGSLPNLSNVSTEFTDQPIDTTESTIESEQVNATDFNSLSSMNMTKLLEINPGEMEKAYGNTSSKISKMGSDLNIKNFAISSENIEELCETSLGTKAQSNSNVTISSGKLTNTVTPNNTLKVGVTTSKTSSGSSGTQTATTSVNITSEESTIANISTITQAAADSIWASSSSSMIEGTTLNPVKLRDMNSKLKRLQKDLKLVNEVQNILNGISDLGHRQEKRDLPAQELTSSSTEKSIFELNFKVMSDLPDKEKEVCGLGKILEWKAKSNEKGSGEKCRQKRRTIKRKTRRKRKRKRKHEHLDRNRRFLGQRPPNFL